MVSIVSGISILLWPQLFLSKGTHAYQYLWICLLSPVLSILFAIILSLWFFILKKNILISDGMTLCRITVAEKKIIFCVFWTVPKAFENMHGFNIIIGSQNCFDLKCHHQGKVRIHNPWAQCTGRLITFSTFEVRIPIWVWININISSQHLIDEKCFLQKEEILLLLLNSS